jgi:hypothetical protein
MYIWLWNLGGREELEFGVSTLKHRRTLFGVSRTREFEMERIAEPHFVESKRRTKSRTPSGIGFRYGGEVIRVGDNLSQHEAKEIVASVIQQFPQLVSCWGQYEEGLPELDELMTLKLR